MKKRLILTMLTIFTFTIAKSQDIENRKFYFELEPLQFVSGGFSVVAHYAVSDRIHIGTNVFAQTLSEGFNTIAFDFDDDALALEATQNFGLNISIRYFLRKDNEGWVASLPIGYETWDFENKTTGTITGNYDFWYIGPRIGYLWHPLKKKRLYLLGEIGAIIPLGIETATLDNLPIEANSFIPLPSIGIGIRF